MFELFLVACVGARICHYVTVPYMYPTESRCHIAAAVLAGQFRGTRPPGMTLTYRHECGQTQHVAVHKPEKSPHRP